MGRHPGEKGWILGLMTLRKARILVAEADHGEVRNGKLPEADRWILGLMNLGNAESWNPEVRLLRGEADLRELKKGRCFCEMDVFALGCVDVIYVGFCAINLCADNTCVLSKSL